MKPIRNVIFDWSGTLVDDLPAVWQASNHVFAQAGKTPLTLDAFRAEFCLPFAPFYDQHLPGVPMEQLERWFHARFREVQDSVDALPHAREFLVFCRAEGLRTFLLSTVHPDHWATQSARTGLGGFIDRPYVGVPDKRRVIHQILAENSLAAAETIFIGDMQHDIETARHGGIRGVAVLTGFNTLNQLRAAEPDLIVEHLGELRSILERSGLRLVPEKIAEEKNPGRDGGRADLRRRGACADDAHAEVVALVGDSRRQDQVWRGVDRCAAARDFGGDEPGNPGGRVCDGAGLHPLAGVLPRRAFSAAELHVPRGGRGGGEVERGGGGICLGEHQRGV